MFRHRKDYVPAASFATYLYRIGRNLWIDRYRSLRNNPGTTSLDAEAGGSGRAMGTVIAGEGGDPSHAFEVQDEMLRVRRALDSLAPDLRETLVLVKYQGMKYAEAAQVLGVPVGTIRSRIHAAIEQVRTVLGINAGR